MLARLFIASSCDSAGRSLGMYVEEHVEEVA